MEVVKKQKFEDLEESHKLYKRFKERALKSIYEKIIDGNDKWLGILFDHFFYKISKKRVERQYLLMRDTYYCIGNHTQEGDYETNEQCRCNIIKWMHKVCTNQLGMWSDAPEYRKFRFVDYICSGFDEIDHSIAGIKTFGTLPPVLTISHGIKSHAKELAMHMPEFGLNKRIAETIWDLFGDRFNEEKSTREDPIAQYFYKLKYTPCSPFDATEENKAHYAIYLEFNKKTIYSLWEEYENAKEMQSALLLTRERDPGNLFHCDELPLDLFKLVFKVTFSYIAGF